MTWKPSPQALLGPKLRALCAQAGVRAGIEREKPRPGFGEWWRWWAENTRWGGHGWAPSLAAARWDLLAFIRSEIRRETA